MKSEIRILHIIEKTTREGSVYREVHCLIKIGSSEFIRKFAVFPIRN